MKDLLVEDEVNECSWDSWSLQPVGMNVADLAGSTIWFMVWGSYFCSDLALGIAIKGSWVEALWHFEETLLVWADSADLRGVMLCMFM